MKHCCKCKKQKKLSEFFRRKRSKDGRQFLCKICSVAGRVEYYKSNKEKSHKYNRDACAARYVKLVAYLKEHPCVDCGEIDPIVLEFDHVRGKKKMPISEIIRSHSWENVVKEIKKCEVRCCNCHRRKTYKRNGWKNKIIRTDGAIG